MGRRAEKKRWKLFRIGFVLFVLSGLHCFSYRVGTVLYRVDTVPYWVSTADLRDLRLGERLINSEKADTVP